MAICTHCGRDRKTTRDHAIPTCTWVGESNDRAIKVPSCEECNHHSEEGLLKTFLSLFDERLAILRLGDELLRPQGVGDLRSLVNICTPDVVKAYPEEAVTQLFKKLFQGLRRYLLRKNWTFIPADNVVLFSQTRLGDRCVVRQLPLAKDGSNQAYVMPQGVEKDDPLKHRFRDFHFGFAEENVLALRYDRTFCGNELVLFALFLEPQEPGVGAPEDSGGA